ncbi:hypothetical protein B0H12DRAFT_1234838 [Mycena haematopus]|nr:hypothetical protein B0H12DRAFT_1234838 [Mycena haematopus]
MVLSTVADIRSLVAHYDPSRSAVPFVSLLLRALMHMCAKGSIIMSETTFVRPRTSTPHRGEFDGVATLLACHSVEGPGADMAVKPSRSSLPAVHSMTMGGASASSSSAASSIGGIDVSLDAHVIPGCGRHQYVLLPFLCVADANHIVDLMASVACQRRVWGIPAPAIGFALSNSGTTATLVLSWHRVHVVCLAPHPNSNQGAALGVFDFTSPFGALSFAQLVLRLSNKFAVVYDHAIAGCKNNSLDWRSDCIPTEAFREPSVARWVHEVALASGKSLSLPPTPPPTKLPSHSPDKSDVTMGSDSKTQMSSSQFAAQSAVGFDQKNDSRADILTWTGDRVVFMDALVERTTGADAKEITEMVRFYEEMCGFLWPSGWDKNTPPRADEGLSDVLDLLLNQAEECRKVPAPEQATTRPKDGKPPAPEQAKMTPEHEKILRDNISALLSACAGACELNDRRVGVKINEAESRHRWDALLYHFYLEAGERASPYVLLEKTIHYARNQSVDKISDETFVEDHVEQLRDYRRHCVNTQLDVMRQDDERRSMAPRGVKHQGEQPIVQQVLAALNRAQELLDVVSSFVERPEDYIEWVRHRSYREPKQGICDAILFAALPGFRDLVADVEFIIDARAPPQEKPTAPKSASAKAKQLLDNPFNVCTTDPWFLRTQKAHEAAHKNILKFQHDLILPHFVAEYKKTDDKDGAKALNQGRMYLVSMVAFYTALGVDDYPFFALVTSGKTGAILMAWKSSKHGRTYLIERNVRTFDISSPIQAFHFATFLLRLRDDQKKLKDRVKSQLSACGEGEREALRDRLKKWSKFAQAPEDTERYEVDKPIRAAKAAQAAAAQAAEAAEAEAAEASRSAPSRRGK